jgi:hypothetical protein
MHDLPVLIKYSSRCGEVEIKESNTMRSSRLQITHAYSSVTVSQRQTWLSRYV